jgi:hypothetical protein
MPLSVAAKRAVFAPESGEAFIILLTIEHPDIADGPIRLARNMVDIVSGGNTYLACPFEVDLPDQREDQLSRVTLRVDNVDRRIVLAVRQIATPPTVTLEVVLGSSPNTVEAGPFVFTLREVDYNALVVEGQLMFEDVLNERYPAHTFSPTFFPGLF